MELFPLVAVASLCYLEHKTSWFARLINFRPEATLTDVSRRVPPIPALPNIQVTAGQVPTTHGKTFYNRLIIGDPNNKNVQKFVFVHGFSIGGVMFHAGLGKIVERYTKQYLQNVQEPITLDLLVIDGYGRGFTDSPLNVRYEADLFVQQIYEVVNIIWKTENHLQFGFLGVSQGGAVSAAFTQKYPELVTRIVLIAPAGLYVPLPAITYLTRIPFVSELVTPFVGLKILKKNFSGIFRKPEKYESEIGFILSSFDEVNRVNPQSVLAISLLVKQFDFTSAYANFQSIGNYRRPDGSKIDVLCFWGTADTVVPYSGSNLLLRAIPQVRLVTIPDGEHGIWTEFIVKNYDTETYFDELFDFLVRPVSK